MKITSKPQSAAAWGENIIYIKLIQDFFQKKLNLYQVYIKFTSKTETAGAWDPKNPQMCPQKNWKNPPQNCPKNPK